MKIRDLLKAQEGPLFSFEFFPPKTPEGEEALFRTMEELKAFRPAFVSITYGAMGSTRERSVLWAKRILGLKLNALAHLTVAGQSQEEVAGVLDRFVEAGVENILALRGDPPQGERVFRPHPEGFRYAMELVAFIRSRYGEGVSVGGAAYPEGHPESESLEADLRHFKAKVEAGLDFAITQLFFNNAHYFGFLERARRMGIAIPILPGIMPITSYTQLRRFTEVCGASIPGPLLSRLERYQEDPKAILEIGVEHATRQVAELLEAGVEGVHFYTLNKSPATRMVLERLGFKPQP
ncbi:methylenetetrahydrofolate reductase [NAD(P)H] [Thermus scotoductus]|uniref:Methylenetetrahydrofolate reductase n=1 Tax=Thermus scotoductus TaxID=37636 RepID=A0A430SDF8_THESC|nr:methylenetetrahydrofolate reductase [NAD(P)H] [Thermus scotoductus]RTG98012.1 methylenetetrahydrofolate reductase [NAD(P)H] [Thermus scotoductus]RTH09400.1 methylenetetrahydrofolate reductase [NAD(P)H] [Thermus scotoductus]RTH13064.1 methylenetetrahydrofolate reductase [NAD(P)H] [Thermus scotoductus]RTH14713.1 methylenetetrahydrofolate reductase [NAD(P)H] [Thermus scotoductus]RTH19817.1 methylenetetrahydrofolate reductase [NAD(P)H] [Thermus scotoductus]